MKAIADTGFIYAFVSSDDLHHGWAMQLADELSGPALTCEAVLAETAYHLRSVDVVLELIEAELILPAFDLNSNLTHVQELAMRYADRKPDLADLCLVRMSELFPDRIVLTTDEKDFRIYRRNKRDVIPLLCPPKSRR
jgi:predicted nucleic acid-binding protein